MDVNFETITSTSWLVLLEDIFTDNCFRCFNCSRKTDSLYLYVFLLLFFSLFYYSYTLIILTMSIVIAYGYLLSFSCKSSFQYRCSILRGWILSGTIWTWWLRLSLWIVSVLNNCQMLQIELRDIWWSSVERRKLQRALTVVWSPDNSSTIPNCYFGGTLHHMICSVTTRRSTQAADLFITNLFIWCPSQPVLFTINIHIYFCDCTFLICGVTGMPREAGRTRHGPLN